MSEASVIEAAFDRLTNALQRQTDALRAITLLVNAVQEQTHAIEQQTSILRGVGVMLDDIADAIVEGNEDRRIANGERATEDDDDEGDDDADVTEDDDDDDDDDDDHDEGDEGDEGDDDDDDEGDGLDLTCCCDPCSSPRAKIHREGDCRSDCRYCWQNSGNLCECGICAICAGGKYTPDNRRPAQPWDGPHGTRRTCPCRWCRDFRKSRGTGDA